MNKNEKKCLGLLLAACMGITACGAEAKMQPESKPSEKQEIAVTQETAAQATGDGLTDFSAVTLDGNQVDQKLFADYDLTIVNVWATWCGPCVRELPELEELHKTLPDNVNIIGICHDADTNADAARQVLTDVGVTYQNLIINDTINQQLLKNIVGFPTTYFLDSEGRLVGEEQLGVPQGAANAADAYRKLVEDRLK